MVEKYILFYFLQFLNEFFEKIVHIQNLQECFPNIFSASYI